MSIHDFKSKQKLSQHTRKRELPEPNNISKKILQLTSYTVVKTQVFLPKGQESNKKTCSYHLYCTGESSQHNQPRKRDKRYSDWKGKRKTIFTDDMVIYIYIHTYIYMYFCFIDYAKAFDYVDHNKLRKILQEMGIPDHLTCLLINLYAFFF